ncbi:MAG: hypothetical protein JWN02_1807 [Acidobacteria bacterium]|jgi:hypothetical protein|nr:hypothetical protein [Acidobacteriota bacterium]
MKKAIAVKTAAPVRKVSSKLPVTESNLGKTAARLLTTKLVSTEISYIRRTLGASATQEELDNQVLAVRQLPWASIVLPD